MLSEHAISGVLAAKVEFWSKRYQFSFQFWGKGNNNVFIQKDSVEIKSFGGRETMREIFQDTVAWCEKANPRIKYPSDVVTVIANPDDED